MLCLEILVLHLVVQSLLGFGANQKKYILEVQHKARKLMKRAPEVMVFPSSIYLGVFQCLRMVFKRLMFAGLCFAPVCSGAVFVWVQLLAGLAVPSPSPNGLDRPLEIVCRLLDILEHGV